MLQEEAMTELITMIMNGWVQIGVAAFMVAMFLYGYRKGLVRMSVNIVSIVVSLIATRMLLPTVQTWIDQNPVLRELVAHSERGRQQVRKAQQARASTSFISCWDWIS